MVAKFVEKLKKEGFTIDAKNSKKDEIDGTYSLPFSQGKSKFTVCFTSTGEVWALDVKKGKKQLDVLAEKYKKVEPLFLKNIDATILKEYL